MHRLAVVQVATTALAVNLFAAGSACSGNADATDQNTFRVMTLNLAHGRGLAKSQAGVERSRIESNLNDAATLILNIRPTVVALQEADAASTWSGGFSHVEYLAKRLNKKHPYHGLHVDVELFPVTIRYGTALLADTPWSHCKSARFDDDWRDTKGFVISRTAINDREVTVVSVHLDYRSAERRLRQAQLLIAQCRNVTGPLIVMGDFNTDGRAHDALTVVREELALSAHQPTAHEPKDCTYPSGHPQQRIDWILVSDAFQWAGYGVDPTQVSDHLAVWADLTWR